MRGWCCIVFYSTCFYDVKLYVGWSRICASTSGHFPISLSSLRSSGMILMVVLDVGLGMRMSSWTNELLRHPRRGGWQFHLWLHQVSPKSKIHLEPSFIRRLESFFLCFICLVNCLYGNDGTMNPFESFSLLCLLFQLSCIVHCWHFIVIDELWCDLDFYAFGWVCDDWLYWQLLRDARDKFTREISCQLKDKDISLAKVFYFSSCLG